MGRLGRSSGEKAWIVAAVVVKRLPQPWLAACGSLRWPRPVLKLDTDQVVSLIGGWQDNFWEALKAGQLLAISMAETHLRARHDVVVPQLATKVEEVQGFQAAADRAGAEYREIVLMASKQQMIDRFAS